MEFPFENATWERLEGAMYMGANSNATLIYTLVSAEICVFVLWHGNPGEQERYKQVDK